MSNPCATPLHSRTGINDNSGTKKMPEDISTKNFSACISNESPEKSGLFFRPKFLSPIHHQPHGATCCTLDTCSLNAGRTTLQAVAPRYATHTIRYYVLHFRTVRKPNPRNLFPLRWPHNAWEVALSYGTKAHSHVNMLFYSNYSATFLPQEYYKPQ